MDWNLTIEETENEASDALESQDSSVATEPQQPVDPNEPSDPTQPEGVADDIDGDENGDAGSSDNDDPETSSAEQPAETERSESESILDEIWNAERKIRECESELEYRKEEVKEAKASLEVAIRNLRNLSQARNEDRPLFPASQQEPDNTGKSAPPSEEVLDQWKEVSIDVLLEPPIKGMGSKKVEALVDEVPTLGEFEKLRTLVGKDEDHLSKLLPKGFGEKLADTLEERQLDYIAKHHSAANEIEGPETPEDQLLQRLSELEQEADDIEDDWMDKRVDPEVWGTGFEAGNAGEEVTECIYEAGENQDDWLRGWASANSEWVDEEVDEVEGGGDGGGDDGGDDGTESDPPSLETEQQPETADSELVDDLADL